MAGINQTLNPFSTKVIALFPRFSRMLLAESNQPDRTAPDL